MLTFSSPLSIINNSSFNLGIEYKQRVGLVKKISMPKGKKYTGQLQFKDGDILDILYENLPENTIEVTYKNFHWANNNPELYVLLFFNFCKAPSESE